MLAKDLISSLFKKKNTLIEWDDFSDLAISYSRAIPSGDPLVLLSSDFLREKIFSIESFKMGKVASFNTKSSNCGELVDELSRVLDNRIEKERKVRLLVDKNCFYLFLDQGQLSLLSDGGEEVAKGDQLRLQVNPNNTLDIYKNGNLLGVSPNLTYSILKLLSLSQVKV